jgi:enoyl-[acyl-carrier-protein] reductase (NADH)
MLRGKRSDRLAAVGPDSRRFQRLRWGSIRRPGRRRLRHLRRAPRPQGGHGAGGGHQAEDYGHSLAFGALKPFIADDRISEQQMDMTLNVMAHSLVYWTQDIVMRGLMGEGGRIFSMTSSGSTRAIHAYGAVSAAKCALESHTRQLAYELAPRGIAVNAIRAGVTITPASSKIPGSDKLFEGAAQKNPGKRLTTPKDVAAAMIALCHPDAGWLTGNVINVDGGEEISAG